MNNEETARDIRFSLDRFLHAANAAEVDDALARLIEEQIQPLVKKILRGKLHASL